MTTYHYQCQHCYCSTRVWKDDDGIDSHKGGAIDDCGCQSDAYYDEYEDEDED